MGREATGAEDRLGRGKKVDDVGGGVRRTERNGDGWWGGCGNSGIVGRAAARDLAVG